MPVCKMDSVRYLIRTGKQGALIGILFIFSNLILQTTYNKTAIANKRYRWNNISSTSSWN